MDKKGQWAHALARERRSQERRGRVKETSRYLKERYAPEDIAIRLGVGLNTVKIYIKEAKALELAERKKKAEEEEEYKRFKKIYLKINKEYNNCRFLGKVKMILTVPFYPELRKYYGKGFIERYNKEGKTK